MYYFIAPRNIRVDNSSFIGGESVPYSARVTGTEFYYTISEIGILKYCYKKAESGFFDIYTIIGRFSNKIGALLSRTHTGILSTYLAWCIIGLTILLLFVFKG